MKMMSKGMKSYKGKMKGSRSEGTGPLGVKDDEMKQSMHEKSATKPKGRHKQPKGSKDVMAKKMTKRAKGGGNMGTGSKELTF
jgi:hypothetical protein